MSSNNEFTGLDQTAGNGSTRRRVLAGAVIGVAAVSIVAAATIMTYELLAISSTLNPSYIATAIGQQRVITLEDGSTVHLNTDSEVTVVFKPRVREVLLNAGEARFVVAKDSRRPFIVRTPQACVRAVGTIFNVRVQSNRTAVAVLEGHVKLFGRAEEQAGSGQAQPNTPAGEAPSGAAQGAAAPQPPLDLYIGQKAAVTPEGTILPGAGPPFERAAAWTERRLIFRDEPLEALVAEFNRYHTRQMRIDDPELAQLRVSGAFDAYDLPTLIQYLEQFQGVHAQVDPDGSAVLTR